MSAFECITSVGQRTRRASSVTSTSFTTRMNRAAFAGEIVARCSSFHQRCCSSVESGMNCVVKNWRYAGSSLPQPISASLI